MMGLSGDFIKVTLVITVVTLFIRSQSEQRLSETVKGLFDNLYNANYHWINACYSTPWKGAAPTVCALRSEQRPSGTVNNTRGM